MFREPNEQDRALFRTLLDEFYHSPAVLHEIPKEYYDRTFDALMQNSPYLKAYFIEQEGETAGYALLSLTFSGEAGGLAVWVEEVYVRPAFQGKGIGGKLFSFLEETFSHAARFRLEVEHDNAGAIRLYERLGYEMLPYLQMVRDKKI